MDNALLTLKHIEASFSTTQERFDYLKENGILSYDEISKKSEASLLNFLEKYRVLIDLKHFDKLSEEFFSAKDLTEALIDEQGLSFENPWDIEMITLALAFLWDQRKKHSPLEFFDVHLHDGYHQLSGENEEKAQEHWAKAMNIMKKTIERKNLTEVIFVEAFDDAHPLSDWVDDFNHLLFQIVNNPVLLEFQEVMNRVIKHFESSQSSFLESFHLNYAQSFYHLGEPLRADAIYKSFLSIRPKWKNGWLRWADNYLYGDISTKDNKIALEILEEALNQVDEEDKIDFFQRIKKIHLDEESFDKIEEIDRKLESLNSFKNSEDLDEESPLLEVEEIEDEILKEAIKKNKLGEEDIKNLFD